MGATEESSPLLTTPQVVMGATAPAASKVAPRSWRFPLWHVCGDGSPHDVVAGCLAWQAPAVAFSWNMNRALQRSFWRELIKIVLILGGAYLLLSVFANVLVFTCTPPPPMDGQNNAGVLTASQIDVMPIKYRNVELPMNSNNPVLMYDGPDGRGPRRGCRHAFDLEGLPAECRARVVGSFFVIAVFGLFVIISAIVYAARRRQQMRAQFGIEGTFYGDFFTWALCPVCALAQETRTLMGAQVHDGVWYGPVAGNANSVPAAQQMV